MLCPVARMGTKSETVEAAFAAPWKSALDRAGRAVSSLSSALAAAPNLW